MVVGVARSGVGAANLLAGMGYEVIATDIKPETELKDFLGKLSPSVSVSVGGHPAGIFEGADLIVVSPGVPLSIEPLRQAKDAGIKIIGELELAYQVLKAVPFYAVTGTNGKSTTSTLLDLMLRKAGRKCIFGGNIGNALTEGAWPPFLSKLATSSPIRMEKGGHAPPVDCIVVEVSSFQLESIEKFRPKGAAVLNITADHLDRYHSMEDYRKAKERISLNQMEGDFLLLNADDPECMKIAGSVSGIELFFFSRSKEVRGIYLKDGTVCFEHYPVVGADEIRIKGIHNLENAMAASAMALLTGCPLHAVRESLKEFPGLEHRLEFVREINSVRYINDSKGTNVGAVIKSIGSFTEPVILIAGGRDKNGDFQALRPFIKNVKAVVVIGEAREKIKEAVCDLTDCYIADGLREALNKARDIAAAGDVVLLSPACASFDMFRDYEDRGRQFKSMVMEL